MIKDENGIEYYGCIYGIKINPKCESSCDFYVGQTVNLKRRTGDHWRGKNKHNMPIDAAIVKYDNKNFEMFIIEYCDSLDELNEAEIFHIAYCKSIGMKLYNLLKGGNNFERSEETKERMSKAQRGRKLSKAHRENIGKAGLGRKHSETTKAKMSKNSARKGKPRSKETKEKLRRSKLGKKLTKEHKAKIKANAWRGGKVPQHGIDKAAIVNSRPIVAINEDNKNIFNFKSINEAGKTLNISDQTISKILNNRRSCNFIKGYTFKYIEDFNKDEIINKTISKPGNSKSIISIDNLGHVKYFLTITEASKILNISANSIGKVLNGKKESVLGYKFKIMI